MKPDKCEKWQIIIDLSQCLTDKKDQYYVIDHTIKSENKKVAINTNCLECLMPQYSDELSVRDRFEGTTGIMSIKFIGNGTNYSSSPVFKKENTGLRYNQGKPKWSLVDFKSILPLVSVLEYGAHKYSTFED